MAWWKWYSSSYYHQGKVWNEAGSDVEVLTSPCLPKPVASVRARWGVFKQGCDAGVAGKSVVYRVWAESLLTPLGTLLVSVHSFTNSHGSGERRTIIVSVSHLNRSIICIYPSKFQPDKAR